MNMTDNEICRNYRAAKDKHAQIKILADMNCTDASKIKRILVDCGEIVQEPQKTNRGKKNEQAPDVQVDKIVVPDAVFEALTAELEALDMQIKMLSDQLNPLVEKYKDISGFMKTYGSV